MNIFLFDSHSLEANAAEFFSQMRKDEVDLFSNAMVVIGHPSIKEWLQIELCKHANGKSTIGLQFVGWRKAVQILSGQSFFPSVAEIAAAIWTSLRQCPIAACEYFLDTEPRSIDFIGHLARLFSEYNEYGFPEKIPDSMTWQKPLFDSIFPCQLDEAIIKAPRPVYLFGVDVLPPTVIRFFFKCAQLRFFRFSPCAMFWEDYCSSSERKRMLKSWQKKQVAAVQLQALDELLKDSQPLLANWGKLGRKMLALVPEVTAENYELEEKQTQLNGLKQDLLLSTQDFRQMPSDGSLRCIRIGSSRHDEVCILQEEIRRYAAEGICFSDMRVYAPDIALYASLIEYCFDDIPTKISGVNIASKSPFYQALLKLFSCVKGRWEADTLVSVFEMPVFYKKMGWKPEDVCRIAEWIEGAGIRWGLDGHHRKDEAQLGEVVERGSWQSGFESLFDSWMFFEEQKEKSIGWGESELFEKFYVVFESLKKTLSSWKKSRTLLGWVIEISTLIDTYLWSDGDSIAEGEIERVLQCIRNLSEEYKSEPFPFAFIETFFFSTISGELGGSSLHSVRFASLELSAILPAKVIFVLGMDEESFPRSSSHSSLRIPHLAAVTQSESDRYLFLSLLFSAEDHLVFSYAHQSADDGKPVSPSLLIQELLGYLSSAVEETIKLHPIKDYLVPASLLTSVLSLPSEDPLIDQIGIQDLSRYLKHPFQHYIKNVLGIWLSEELESAWKEFEFSSLSRHWLLRSFLEPNQAREALMPLGLFGECARKSIEAETANFSKALQGWGIDPASIHTVRFDQQVAGVRLFGEATLAVSEGALHLGSDNIGSLLRRWVEILTILVAKGKTQVFFLKTGKVKEIERPQEALESIMHLYARSQKSPLFLHPDWADTILRKQTAPDLDSSEDPVLDWVLSRSPGYDLQAEKDIWLPALQPAFSSLISLYPTRSKNAEI